MGMTIEDGFDLSMRFQNLEETIGIQKVTITFSQGMMHKEDNGAIICFFQKLLQPGALILTEQASNFVRCPITNFFQSPSQRITSATNGSSHSVVIQQLDMKYSVAVLVSSGNSAAPDISRCSSMRCSHEGSQPQPASM